MAKPATPAQGWATDTNYSTGPNAGTPTKVEPSAGEKASGFVPGSAAVAQHMNFELNLLAQWTQYLDGLETDPDFVDQDFAWGGEHTFDADVNIEGQAAVGTLRVGNGDIFLDVGGAEVLYSTGGVPDPISRNTYISLAKGQAALGPGSDAELGLWRNAGQLYWFVDASASSARLHFPLELPTGAKVNGVTAGFKNQSAGSRDVAINIYSAFVNVGTPGSSALTNATQAGTGAATLSSGADTVVAAVVGGLLPGYDIIDNTVNYWSIEVEFTGGNVELHWLAVSWDDPGPRNY